jgi:hypothetical protein
MSARLAILISTAVGYLVGGLVLLFLCRISWSPSPVTS